VLIDVFIFFLANKNMFLRYFEIAKEFMP
jgi:hypothetical protein